MKIFDNSKKIWLKPMAIFFDVDGRVSHVIALYVLNNPERVKRLEYKGDDIKKLEFVGELLCDKSKLVVCK